MPTYNFVIESHLKHLRLDKALVALLGLSRSKLQTIIKSGNVTVNNNIIKDLDYTVSEEDNITVNINEPKKNTIKANDIKLDIIYEDADIIVINKQAGLTVHPGAGNYDDTLVNALVSHYGQSLSQIGGADRPGIVHRLDRDTSGLMVIAKNDAAHANLSEAIAARKVNRWYKALIWGSIMPPQGTINANISRSHQDRKRMAVSNSPIAKTAITHYNTISSWKYISLIECKLETGRTHQIRVHLSHIRHSVIGDKVYGQNARKIAYYTEGELKEVILNLNRQALHSYKLEFAHPTTNQFLSFTAELPEDMSKILGILNT